MKQSEIKALLHEQNFRLTHERQIILDLFSESTKLLTPSELYDLAKSHQLKIGLTTIYRLLEVLTKTEIATPFLIEGTIYYAFCGSRHHHHFVCLSCHQVLDIHEGCPSIEVPDNIKVESHRLDLFGRCSSCQDTEGREVH